LSLRTRVVIGDDNDSVRLLLRTLLELEHDFAVVGEADDGAAIVSLVASCEPDLLVLDLAMPRLDGLEVLQRLRGEQPALRIAVYSGHSAPEVQQAARDLGAHEFIVKGTPPDELLRALRRAVDGA
jgi:DNA-binding NarL/FixJ family response regulator